MQCNPLVLLANTLNCIFVSGRTVHRLIVIAVLVSVISQFKCALHNPAFDWGSIEIATI